MAKKIFLVDDDDSVRKTLFRLLRRHRPDDAVTEFSDPADLVRMALEGRWPDLVVTDRDMPGMNGEELAHRLKYAGYTGVVIMITGNDAIVVPPKDIDHVLHKPFESKEVLATVAHYLDAP